MLKQFSEDSDILVLIFDLIVFCLLFSCGLKQFGHETGSIFVDCYMTYIICQVLLMSLKAGGVGINLTAASNAFVLVCIGLDFKII